MESQHTLRRRELEVVYIATDGHLQRAGKSLEDALDLVVLIVAFGLDIKIDAGTVAERLEEVQEHLGRHIADTLAMEFGIPYKPWTSAEVESDLTETIVHRKAESITSDTTLVAQGLGNTFAQRDTSILDRMMFVDIKIALHLNGQIHA